jgi:O-antigen ligase
MNSYAATPESRIWSANWALPLVFLTVFALCLVAALANGLAPLAWVVAPFAVVGFIALAWSAPEVFLAAAIFIPQWKAYWPFSLFKASDYLTIVMLAGLALGLIFITFRISLGTDRWTFESIVFRQRLAIGLFFLFGGIVALSYVYTDAPLYGGTKLARLLFIGGLFLIAPLMLFRTEKLFRRFARLFVGCGIITALQMIAILKSRSATSDTDITRIGAGWMIGMALLLLLFYPVFNTSGRQKVLFALCLPLLAAGLVASAARGALVSFALILPVALLIGPRQKQKGMTLVVVMLGFCAFGAYMFLRGTDPEKYSAKISELIAMSEGRATSGSAGKRLAFYRHTAEAIPEHALLGNGVGSWSVFYFGNDARAYPHNLLLEIGFEEGLLGIAAFALFFVAIGSTAYRTYQLSGPHFTVVPILLLYGLVVCNFSGDLDDNRLLWLWAGVALALCRNVSLARAQVFQFSARNRARPHRPGRHRPTEILNPQQGLPHSI